MLPFLVILDSVMSYLVAILWSCLVGFVVGLKLTEENPELERRLKGLLRNGAQGRMRYRFSDELPQTTDIFCSPTHGKAQYQNGQHTKQLISLAKIIISVLLIICACRWVNKGF